MDLKTALLSMVPHTRDYFPITHPIIYSIRSNKNKIMFFRNLKSFYIRYRNHHIRISPRLNSLSFYITKRSRNRKSSWKNSNRPYWLISNSRISLINPTTSLNNSLFFFFFPWFMVLTQTENFTPFFCTQNGS